MNSADNNRWRATSTEPRPATTVLAGLHQSNNLPLTGHPDTPAGLGASAQVRAVGAAGTGEPQSVGPDVLIAGAIRPAGEPGVSAQQQDRFSETAHELAGRAYADSDPRAVDAVRLRATVLDERGDYAQAARIWGRMIGLYQLIHRPAAEREARLAQAVDLHRCGTCGEAFNQIAYAWQLCTSQPVDGEPGVAVVLRQYAAMLAACGQHDDREALLAEAAALPGVDTHTAHDNHDEQTLIAEPHRVCAYRAHARREGRP